MQPLNVRQDVRREKNEGAHIVDISQVDYPSRLATATKSCRTIEVRTMTDGARTRGNRGRCENESSEWFDAFQEIKLDSVENVLE